MNSNDKNFDQEYVKYDQDELDRLIYNDLDINTLFEEKEEDYSEILQKMLYEGEVAKNMPKLPIEYYITNFGRVLNTKRVMELTVRNILDTYLTFTCRSVRWILEPIMEEAGFIYDRHKILEYYKEINYPHKTTHN